MTTSSSRGEQSESHYRSAYDWAMGSMNSGFARPKDIEALIEYTNVRIATYNKNPLNNARWRLIVQVIGYRRAIQDYSLRGS
jgi:hypothetical protein